MTNVAIENTESAAKSYPGINHVTDHSQLPPSAHLFLLRPGSEFII